MRRMEWAHNQEAKPDSVAAKDAAVRESLPKEIAADLDPRNEKIMNNYVKYMRVRALKFLSRL